MASYEQAALKQTEAFILYRPDDIVLLRAPREADGAGGVRKGAPVALAAQVGRLVATHRVPNTAPMVTTVDGRQVRPDWALVFMPDADVQAGDETTVRGHKLEIVFIQDVPTHRLTAQAVEHG